MKRGILLVLLWFFCVGIPVQASNLTGDGSGAVIGSTTVTARIEMPEDAEEENSEKTDGDSNTDAKKVTTGDETKVLWMLFLIGMSGILIMAIWKIKEKMK